MKKIFFISSDFSKNTGEGILANQFIKIYKKNHTKIKIKRKIFALDKLKKNTLYHKYFIPVLISLYIRLNSDKKYIFLNYLPLWNFLIFLILPKNSVLGPITGSYYEDKITNFSQIIRKYIFPQLFKISKNILKFKFKKILFSTSLLKKKVNSSTILFNFVISLFTFQNKKKKIKYDLIFYNRDHPNKQTRDISRIINEISKSKKICVIGNKLKIKNKNIKNFGYISRNKVFKVMLVSKFAFCSPENLYSIFAIDAYNNQCQILFSDKLKKYIFKKSLNFHPIKYIYSKRNISKILKILNNNNFQKDLKFKKEIIQKQKNINQFIRTYLD